jgi:hypothetical protein
MITIDKLSEKARLRNKDEFYFGMVNSKVVNGQHVNLKMDKLKVKNEQLDLTLL